MSNEAQRSALIVLDVQPGVVDRVPDSAAYLERVKAAVQAARSHAIQVIQVVVGFRSGMPELAAKNQVFGPYKAAQPAMLIEPRPAVAAEGTDIVVTKRRASAFTGSDLEVVLRSAEIQHLVLCGVVTSGAVLSTLLEASDKDYGLTLLSDLCFDPDAEVHAMLMGKVFPRRAKVVSAADWAAGLG